MSIYLSDVALRPGLVWKDRWGSQNVQQSTIRTLGGVPVFYHAALHSGNAVTLESLDDQGWQTYETVQKLYALAAVPGAQYLLDLGSVQFSVLFRHEDAPAFEATPLIQRTAPLPGDYFTVSLKLITV